MATEEGNQNTTQGQNQGTEPSSEVTPDPNVQAPELIIVTEAYMPAENSSIKKDKS